MMQRPVGECSVQGLIDVEAGIGRPCHHSFDDLFGEPASRQLTRHQNSSCGLRRQMAKLSAAAKLTHRRYGRSSKAAPA